MIKKTAIAVFIAIILVLFVFVLYENSGSKDILFSPDEESGFSWLPGSGGLKPAKMCTCKIGSVMNLPPEPYACPDSQKGSLVCSYGCVSSSDFCYPVVEKLPGPFGDQKKISKNGEWAFKSCEVKCPPPKKEQPKN